MGVVAECTHLALNERVAIKMLRQDVLLDQDAVYRFLREAQAAVKLKSEYVARVSDVGTFENGVPYMVMEFLEGHDLGELLKQRGVLPVQWAVELMLQTAEALAEAHSLNIVHRDVKPTNLFVTWRPDGTALIKVLDFGISKSPLGTDMQLTQTQSLLGTPAYMSPEQMRSARLVDARTDIWSLGTVFYEILEGRRPFEAESFSEMCVKVAVDPPAPMVNTPAGLQQIIMRCLAKSPEQRYASMADLGRDLVPYSSDPHGAQMLVERMGRMLRRAAHDWEGAGSSVRRAHELGSGPVARAQTPAPQQWGIGSDPAASPWNAKSDPAARAWHGTTPRGDGSQPFARPISDASQPFARNDGSQPFVRPLGDESAAGYAGATVVKLKKSRLPLILILLAGIAAAGVGVGFYVSNREEPAPVAQQQPADTVELPTTPTVVETKTDTPAPPATDIKEDIAPTAVPPTEVKVEPKKTGTAKVAKSGATKTGTAKSTKPDGKTQKTSAGSGEPAAEPKKEPAAQTPEKPCNPFASMHGCPSK
jgi:eukaryotic-like serine/threonine-protein kinase